MRKQPITPIAANKAQRADKKQREYKLIVEAPKVLGFANYEAIAVKSGINKTEVGRRLSEARELGLIVKLKLRTVTSTGCDAFCYAVPISETIKTDDQERYVSEVITIPKHYCDAPTLF